LHDDHRSSCPRTPRCGSAEVGRPSGDALVHVVQAAQPRPTWDGAGGGPAAPRTVQLRPGGCAPAAALRAGPRAVDRREGPRRRAAAAASPEGRRTPGGLARGPNPPGDGHPTAYSTPDRATSEWSGSPARRPGDDHLAAGPQRAGCRGDLAGGRQARHRDGRTRRRRLPRGGRVVPGGRLSPPSGVTRGGRNRPRARCPQSPAVPPSPLDSEPPAWSDAAAGSPAP
jgi:hypothetical protein